MLPTGQITPCLWFDDRIEEAVNFYISVFGGEIRATSHYGDAVPDKKGKVLTIVFRLKDQDFMALNGGPEFKFTEADLVLGPLREPGRDRPLLEGAHRGWRRGVAVRLAQGQVRPVVADHSERDAEAARRQGPGEGQARHAGDDAR